MELVTQIQDLNKAIYILSKLADCSRRQLKGSLFNSYYTKV